MRASPLKVLYVLGWGRSGSTVLDNLLGQIEGFFSVGELCLLWERLLDGRNCACGRRVPECEVWSRVLPETAAARGLRAIQDLARWHREHLRIRHTWRILRMNSGRPVEPPPLRRYAEALSDVYRALGSVTGVRVIVDSSKRPSDAALLSRIEGIEPYLVQLVRDPRAVAFSWQRRTPRLDRDATGEIMPRHNAVASTIYWIGWNLASESVRRRYPKERSLVLRYEDFAAQPRATIEAVVRLVGEPVSRLPFTDDRTVELHQNHAVSGNPSRFRVGPMGIREDDEWKRRQRRIDRILSSAVAAPLLGRYGYPIVPSDGSRPVSRVR